MRQRKIDDAQREEICRLRDQDRRRWSYSKLAKHFGCSAVTISRIIRPDLDIKIGRERRPYAWARQQMEADARVQMRQIPPDRRDLTQIVCGDPLFERSALGQRQLA